jgi:hypothetical protein
MNAFGLKKDHAKKIALTLVGFVILLYVYFSFFLGPLNRSRNAMQATIQDKQGKLDSSQENLGKTSKLEQQAKAATAQFATLQELTPEGAPIAWFPPKIRSFFANRQIDKATARLENNTAFKQAELANWLKYAWLVDIPQADYARLGKAIAELENDEPLLSITKLSIHFAAEQPEYQQVVLSVTNVIQKK